MGIHSLLQRIVPAQGSKPGLLYCRWILYHLSHQGSPRIFLFWGFPSHLGHHRAWIRVPCAISRFSLVIYFICGIKSIIRQSHSPNSSHRLSPLGIRMLFLYFCISVSALQIKSCLFLTVLIKYSFHTIKYTLLKCTVQWFLIYSQSCPIINFM